MDYVEIKSKDLIVGQVYTDVQPDAKTIKPMRMKLIKKSQDKVAFRNLSDHSNGYCQNEDGLIYFNIDDDIYYKEIKY